MNARDDYPKLAEWSAIADRSLTHEQLVAALDEIDRLRAELQHYQDKCVTIQRCFDGYKASIAELCRTGQIYDHATLVAEMRALRPLCGFDDVTGSDVLDLPHLWCTVCEMMHEQCTW